MGNVVRMTVRRSKIGVVLKCMRDPSLSLTKTDAS